MAAIDEIRLTNRFFQRPTLEVARDLLGMRLSTRVGGVLTSGMIVEVEAYRGDIDPASHSFGGPTARNEVMFKAGGHCYVYQIYGIHHCVNVVTEKADVGAGVLIRALEPLDGIDTMKRRRGLEKIEALTSGPGKLCQALGIDRALYGHHYLVSELITLAPFRSITAEEVAVSTRIGITKAADLPWRFYVKGNRFVSKR